VLTRSLCNLVIVVDFNPARDVEKLATKGSGKGKDKVRAEAFLVQGATGEMLLTRAAAPLNCSYGAVGERPGGDRRSST
jgi:hypothetical protein